MNIWIYIIIMAVIQGVAEFLPVSSSGHLALLGALFGFDGEKSQALGIVLHAGSLLAIVVFYWKTLLGFLKPERWRLAAMLIVATIPAGAAGLLLEFTGAAKEMFDNLFMVGFAFLITGTLLRMTEKPKLIVRPAGEEDAPPTPLENISLRQAVVIGLGQMFAILPGLSRSGTTITAGILTGVNREAAGTFSFLMAIPVIAGAALVHLLKIVKNPPEAGEISILQMGVGLAVSAAVSYGALYFLTKLIKRGKLACFACYLYLLGGGVILWQLAVMIRKANGL
ncbi:undecaprenyl-diphosphate phosphatase [uncultured Victivallis sp.]|uniref:undecaprenyl-diphosphate phosphatase n=1 Tax=uncultured Victivallis sp. TaxID=354118 RepID=UPI0025D1ABCB|nr:undecaprenyl-diphosphate phosphatase [uncultured Victivallis sp.]